MALEEIERILNLFLAGSVTTALVVIGLVFGLIKQGKMIRSQIRQGAADAKKAEADAEAVELENSQRKLDLAHAMSQLADETALKAVDAQNKFAAFQKELNDMRIKINDQEGIIQAQQKTIKKQENTISILKAQNDVMLERTNKQDEEIATLICRIQRYEDIFNKLKTNGLLPEDVSKDIDNCIGDQNGNGIYGLPNQGH